MRLEFSKKNNSFIFILDFESNKKWNFYSFATIIIINNQLQKEYFMLMSIKSNQILSNETNAIILLN